MSVGPTTRDSSPFAVNPLTSHGIFIEPTNLLWERRKENDTEEQVMPQQCFARRCSDTVIYRACVGDNIKSGDFPLTFLFP